MNRLELDLSVARDLLGSNHWLERDSVARHYFSSFSKFIDHSGGNNKLLDVGCSAGKEAADFMAMGFDVSGIDKDQQAIDQAKKIHKNISFKVASAEAIPYPSDSFDVVFCINTLFFLDQKLALPEIIRVTKKGGVIVISYDILILKQKEKEIIYKSSLQYLNKIIKEFSISKVYQNYNERIDIEPFIHEHSYFELVYKKS